jgi:hypothetical protein
MKVTTIHKPKEWQEVINRVEVKEDSKTIVIYTLADGSSILRSQVLDFLYDEELGDLDEELRKIDS